jgi:DNA polymerase-1
MLEQLVGTWAPTHWAVVFDGGLPTERLELLNTYKAQRPPMPDALRSQMEWVEEYLDRAGVAWVRQERQEADDVLASMATWAEADAERILIGTSDKDIYQLVNGRIRLVGVSGKGVEMGPVDVEAKTGVPPSRIVEWLALVGDAADNIPGVPGIGPKTAARLLKQYGSLNALWAGLAGLESERLRKSLEENRGVVERNLGMIRLRKDLPCRLGWDDMLVRSPDPARMLPFFEKLEFKAMARNLEEPSLL